MTDTNAISRPGVEDDLKAVRSAVRRREPGAAARAEALRGRIAALAADTEVLRVLDDYRRDPAAARPRAAALADQISGREPADADAARDQSLLLLYAGRREAATAAARAALTRYPRDVGLLLVIVEATVPEDKAGVPEDNAGSPEASIPADKSAVPDETAVTGAIHELVRDPAMVTALLAELDASSPSAEVSCWLALGAIRLGRAALALELANRALAAGPDDLRIRAIRLRCLILLDLPAEALDEAGTLLEREPSLLIARLDRTRALARLGRAEDAIAALSELRDGELDSVTTGEVAALRIEVLASSDRVDDALELGDQMAAEHPGDPLIAMARARILTGAGDWEKALAVVVEARAGSEANAELHYAHAFILKQLGRPEEALDVLRAPAALDPLDLRAQLLLAELLDELGHTDEAMAVLDQAAARDPGDTTVAERRVGLLFAKSRYIEALDALDQVRAAGIETPGLLLLRAQVLVSLERYDEASSSFDSVLDAPQDVDEPTLRAVEDGARQLFFAGRMPAALTLFKHIDGRDALTPAGRALLAELLRFASDPTEAVAQADRVLALTDDLETRVSAMGTKSMALIWLSRSAEALETIDEALRAADGYLFGWMARALAVCALERPGESLRVLEEHFPHDAMPEGWAELALTSEVSALGAAGRNDEAITVLNAALDAAPAASGETDGATLLRSGLGYYYIRVGRYADAVGVLEPGRRDDAAGWDPWAMNNLVIALMMTGGGDQDELRGVFERELRLAATPVVPYSQAATAWAHFWLGRHDDAIASIDAALAARKEPFLQNRIALSLLMFGMGRTERAKSELRQALAEAGQLDDEARAAELLSYGQWLSGVLVKTGHLREIPAALSGRRAALQLGG